MTPNEPDPESQRRTADRLLRLLNGKPLLADLQRWAEQLAPRAPAADNELPPDAALDLVRKMLLGCEAALPADPPGDRRAARARAARVLCLAWLVRAAVRYSPILRSVRGVATVRRKAQHWRARLDLAGMVAQELGWDFDGLADCPDRSVEVQDIARDFLAAASPRPLGSLLKNPKVLRERVHEFVDNRGLTGRQVRGHARSELKKAGLKTKEARRLTARLGVPRLRTYSDEHLATIAGHFRDWDPLIRHLRACQAGRPAAPAQQERLEELMKHLEAAVRADWCRRSGSSQVEDAIHHAFAYAYENLTHPRRGYSYESDLLTWLYSIANHWLVGTARERARTLPLPDEVGPLPSPRRVGLADAGETLGHLELFQALQERYLVAETFFQRPKRPRVKAIWAIMLKTGEEGVEISDAEMAQRLAQDYGFTVGLNTLVGIRRRLRQKLEALHYVLDRVPDGDPDVPGDQSVLDWVERKRGLAPNDEPTICGLAALGRAARAQRTLLWALLARYRVDRAAPESEARATLEQLIAAKSQLGYLSKQKLLSILDTAWSWFQDPDHPRRLSQLRGSARASGIVFFVAPSWDLVVIGNKTANEVLEILLPAPEEEALVRRIVESLR